MLFNSYEFLFLLLPLALAGYYVFFRAEKARLVLLTLLSYLFYGWWDYRFCALMVVSTLVDYVAGLRIAASENPGSRRRWLVVSMVANLSLLGFFKYFDLIAGSVNYAAAWAGAPAQILPLLHLTLPVGISFYTFQSMSYTIDVYFRQVQAQRSLLTFAFYVSFFPQLVAGPIVRYRDLEEQLRQRAHTFAKAAAGVSLFILGLAKKVLLADSVAPLVADVFAMDRPGLIPAWLGSLAYAAQIYFDFSGYSDMAVGLGLLFGFRFPQNFNSPYKAVSITDFWRRWHISLSTWLRDYLYVPLGGNRLGALRTYINLFLTMLLGGLWHGANWTFVCWGAYHGVLLALERARPSRSLWASAPRPVRVGLTFVLVLLGWLIFRCETLGQAGRMLAGMAGIHGLGADYIGLYGDTPLPFIGLPVCFALAWFAPNTWEIRPRGGPLLAVALAALFVACLMVILVNSSSPFLYFQF